ncbi:MAG TPA: hypothetical protein DDY98_06020 [Ruminococcaceae bacterium]|nr:hypothetical protein [Oscillospiraceae bacterium]
MRHTKAFFLKIGHWFIKPRPLQLQLTMITSATICIGLLSIVLLNSRFSKVFYQSRQEHLLSDSGKEIAVLLEGNREKFFEKTADIEAKASLEIEIFNAEGILLYDTNVNRFAEEWFENSDFDWFQSMISKSDKIPLKKIKEDEHGIYEIQQDANKSKQYLTYTTVLKDGTTIKVNSQLDYLNNTANATTRQVSWIAGATFLLIIIILYLFVRRFTKPIREMNRITRSMASMDFSQKCTAQTKNELSELSENINTLSESLNRTLCDLQEKNKQLEADIKHERQLETMRKEFVSSASHELKTPIAIIQGYAEGLKLGIQTDAALNNDYCDIIIEETRKMNHLVRELLELSKYEAGSYTLEPKAFDIADFIEESLGSYAILAKEKGILLTIHAPSGSYGFGDASKLEIVLHNFVSNALAHADGELLIEVRCEETENGYRISVFNTGDPIPEEELPHLWISFYRIDKSHSRDQGRFGLGLSISKAILDMHQANYGVENRENGVVFYFDIDKAEPIE